MGHEPTTEPETTSLERYLLVIEQVNKDLYNLNNRVANLNNRLDPVKSGEVAAKETVCAPGLAEKMNEQLGRMNDILEHLTKEISKLEKHI